MQVRIVFFLSLSLFIVGCLLIYYLHREISENIFLSIAVLSVTGLAMITWPIALSRVIQDWINRLK